MTFLQKVRGMAVRASIAGTFPQQVDSFISEARALAADGLTLAEVGHLFVALITLAVEAAGQLGNSGEQKKAFVLQAVGHLYDAIAPNIPLPWFLQLVRAWLRPYVRSMVLSLADGVIEAVYRRFQEPATA